MQRRLSKQDISFSGDKITQPNIITSAIGSLAFLFWYNSSLLILHEQVTHVFYHGHLF